jgi:hypothetical protein
MNVVFSEAPTKFIMLGEDPHSFVSVVSPFLGDIPSDFKDIRLCNQEENKLPFTNT